MRPYVPFVPFAPDAAVDVRTRLTFRDGRISCAPPRHTGFQLAWAGEAPLWAGVACSRHDMRHSTWAAKAARMARVGGKNGKGARDWGHMYAATSEVAMRWE